MCRLLPLLHVRNSAFRLHQNISFSDSDYNSYSIRHVASLSLFAQPKLHSDEPVKKFVIKENQKENIVFTNYTWFTNFCSFSAIRSLSLREVILLVKYTFELSWQPSLMIEKAFKGRWAYTLDFFEKFVPPLTFFSNNY